MKGYSRKAHTEFVQEHKRVIMALDMMVVMIVLMHWGAIGTTNMMAVKELPEEGVKITMKEVNPVMAEVEGYEVHPEYRSIVLKLMMHLLYYIAVVGGYVYLRLTMKSFSDLVILSVLITAGFLWTGIDFFNNLGYLVGYKLYG